MSTRVKISNIAIAMENPDMLAECLQYAHGIQDSDITVTPRHRRETGWLEWAVSIKPLNLTPIKNMIVIQKAPDDKYTFNQRR